MANSVRPILTAQVGANAQIFADVLRLYVPEGSRILDMTYGQGMFWREADRAWYGLSTNDLVTNADYHDDFAKLLWDDQEFDAVVFDPPYAGHGLGPNSPLRKQYGLDTLGPGWSTRKTREMYRAGLAEAHRVLRVGGVAIVKCQDGVESGRQQWVHVDVLGADGFEAVDLFVVVQQGKPIMRHKHQVHARKNHSYFIVLRKV